MSEAALLGGALLGIAGLTYATFVTVSYNETKAKIGAQIAAGEEPYELQVEKKRRKPPQKKKKSTSKRSN